MPKWRVVARMVARDAGGTVYHVTASVPDVAPPGRKPGTPGPNWIPVFHLDDGRKVVWATPRRKGVYRIDGTDTVIRTDDRNAP